MNLIVMLLILNMPVYWLFGWALFTSSQSGSGSFWETTMTILREAFTRGRPRPWTDDEPDSGAAIFNRFFFFASCAAVVGGEYYLLTKYVWLVE